MFVYVCVNTRDISSTHTWYGSGKIFRWYSENLPVTKGYLPLSVMIMHKFRSIPWTDGKRLPNLHKFMLPYRQSDQLDFHISKGSLVEWILGETIQSLKRRFRKLIGQYTLMFEQLQTLFVEVKGIVNLPHLCLMPKMITKCRIFTVYI